MGRRRRPWLQRAEKVESGEQFLVLFGRSTVGRKRLMKPVLFVSILCLLFATLGSDSQAKAFVNDNDGLLDVGEAQGFPDDPAATTGELLLYLQGIEDLDGTSLLTGLQSFNLEENNISSIESGEFGGLTLNETSTVDPTRRRSLCGILCDRFGRVSG